MDEQELQALFDKLRSGAQLTDDELKKLNTALNGSTKNLDQFKSALKDSAKDVTKSLGRFALDIGDGSKGFTQLNPLIDSVSNALGGMAKAIPFAGEAMSAAVKATAEGTKFVIEQLQKTTQTFQDLSDVGAVTAKGMSGIQEQFLRSGMSLNGFQKSIKENSASLARFRGLTADGAEEFSKIVGGIVDSKAGDELRRIGFSADAIGEASGAYVAQQTRLGLAQNKTQKQLSQGAVEYAKELDQLTKLTGMSRKEIQAQQDAALSEGRFRAQYDEMVANGQEAAAKELLDFQTQISKIAPELGQAIRDQSTGMTNSDAAIKGFNSTAGQLPDIIERLKAGEITRDQAIQELQNATRDNVQTQRDYSKALGDGTGTFLKYSELSDLNNATMADGVLKAKQAQDAQVAGQDELTNKTVEAQKNMEQMSRQIQNLGFTLMPAAATAISGFTDSLNEFLKFVSKTTGVEIPGIAGGKGGTGVGAGPGRTAADTAATAVDLAVNPDKLLADQKSRAELVAKQDEENYKKAKLTEKASIVTAKAIENLGDALGDVVSLVGVKSIGSRIKGIAGAAKEERVASDTAELEKTGRGDAGTKKYLGGQAAPAGPAGPSGGAGQAGGAVGSEPVGPGAQGKPGGAGGGANTRSTGGKATTDKPIKAVTGAGPGFTEVQTTDDEKQRREGVRNWRNNNPGNLEMGAFARSFGAVGSDGRFAVFPTLADGTKAKEELLFGSKSKYANLSITDALNRYAPPNENNTAAYIKSVASAVGVDPGTILNKLDSGQRLQMLEAISRVEGFKTGKIVSAADGGVFSGPTKGYPATLHGTEAVIPMSDGKSIPVKFDKPDRQQLVEAYKDMFKTLNPAKSDSINISDIVDDMTRSIAPDKNAIGDQITSAIRDMTRSIAPDKNAIGDQINTAFKDLSKSLTPPDKNAVNINDQINTAFKDLSKSLTPPDKNATGDQINTAFKDLSNSLAIDKTNVNNQITTAFKDLSNLLTIDKTNINDQITTAFKDMSMSMAPDKNNISDQITSAIKDMSKSLAIEPIKFDPPSIQQLVETYGDAFRTLIPGMTVNKQGDGLAIELGSVADKLSMAVDEMFAAMPEMKKQFNYGKMEPGDFMRAMLATPEGKVFSAQNDIGVQGKNSLETEESKALRDQYDLIREMIRQQDSAAIKAGKMSGGSIEDPLSRMEVLAEDYIKRQQVRTGWGTGDWQTGEVGKQNLFDDNAKVITELVKGLQENAQTATEDKVTGILEKFTNSFKEMFTQQSTQRNTATPELIGAIQEMVQAQRDNVSISSKILQVSQN